MSTYAYNRPPFINIDLADCPMQGNCDGENSRVLGKFTGVVRKQLREKCDLNVWNVCGSPVSIYELI